MGVEMTGQIVRSKYNRQFAGLKKYNHVQAWFVFGSFVVQYIVCIVMGHILLSLEANPAVIMLMIFFAVFAATRLRALNNIVHECAHMTFGPTRSANVLFGSLSASLVLSCFQDYRDEHLTHHTHLGDYDRDMDLHGIKDLGLHDQITLRTILRHLVTPFIGRHLPYYLNANMSARDGSAYLALKAGIILGTLVFLLIAPLTALIFVILPFTFIYSAFNYWTDCLDHAGLLISQDELDASRNVLATGIVRFLFFPRNDCFHLVHHLFPHVPARHLEFCHNILETEDHYRERPHASRLGRKVKVQAGRKKAVTP